MREDYIDWVPMVLKIAKKAGTEIMEFYKKNNPEPLETKLKHDLSPVTAADLCAHQIILEGLLKLTPDIPVLSEEGPEVPFHERTRWSRYWLVDPLDGTREFLARTGEFGVNIALIDNHCPVLGIVVVPLLQESYWALKNHAAYYQQGENKPTVIHVSTSLKSPLRIAVSRRHSVHDPKFQAFLERLRQLSQDQMDFKFIPCGSALKICLVARGMADIYPRLGLTGEWDTASGQCILEAAGGVLCDLEGESLKYNTKSSLFNPGFLAIGSNKLNDFFCG
jgi:3'(2'), 5'-bisphosphate nucleotidase